jgi:Glycosyltransferase
MVIAYFSPFSPDRSGISDFSEELVLELSNFCQVDLYSNKSIENKEIQEKFNVYKIEDIDNADRRKKYDHLVYQVGNNRTFHKAVVDTFLKYPGILELHDFSLHHYLAEDTFVQKEYDKYIEIMKYCHGNKGEYTAKRFLKGEIRAPWEDSSAKFTVNKHLIDKATAVIVHSDWAKQMVKGICSNVPVLNIPLHTTDLIEKYKLYQENCKQELCLQNQFVFGSFGYVTSAKRIEPIIQALSRLKKEKLFRFKYLIVGKVENVPVDTLKKQYDLQEEIIVTNFIELSQFKVYMGACDICFNLRYPTQGESSASLHRMFGLGKVVLVTKIGSFEEYPDDVVIKIGYGNSEVDEIVDTVKALIDDRNSMDKRQDAVYEFARRHLDLHKNAKIYLEFFKKILKGRFEEEYEDYLLDYLQNLDLLEEKNAIRIFENVQDWFYVN